MDCQIEQMKSSIANIQQSLRRLEHEDTVKINDQILLPDSIIHEHPLAKENPTPKITASVPNITRTQKFTPTRHHLDDTQMKKALKYSECLSHTKKSKLKQKSSTAKVKYIYDGARVVYVPPTKKQVQNQYGHFVIESDRNHRKQSQSQLQNNLFDYYLKSQQQNRAQTQRNHNHKKKKNKWKKEQSLQKPKNMKISQSNDHFSAYIPYDTDRITQKVKKSKQLKSTRIQCKMENKKIKQPFIIDWDANTDSQFSEMQL